MGNYKAEEIKTATITQSEFGKLFGITQQRVSQLCDEQILVRDETSRSGKILFFESLKSYLLSKKSTEQGVNFWTEKSLHEKAKRELAELKLKERQGELYEADTVERVLADLLTDFRNKLLGIGHKLASQLENLPAAKICDIIDAEVIANMKELAEGVDKAKYTAEETSGGRESPDVANS